MAENEIVKLVKTWHKFWDNDVESLRNDVGGILTDEYGWDYFDDNWPDDEVRRYSYFSRTKIAFVYVDANVNTETPCLQLILCSLNDRKKGIDKEWLKENDWKGYDPRSVSEEEKKNKRIVACFENFSTLDGDWLSVKIDLLSIDSTDRVNTDVKALLDAMINGTYKKFDPKSSKLTFVSYD